MRAQLDTAGGAAWQGLAAACPWGALEVAIHPGPQPLLRLLAALLLTGAAGMAFGLTAGLLAGWGVRPWLRKLLLLGSPLLCFIAEVAWAIDRAADLSPWPGHIGVWSVATGAGLLAGWGIHRMLRQKLHRSRTIALAVTVSLALTVVLLEPAQRFHEALGQFVPWAYLLAALYFWCSGVARRIVLPMSALLVGLVQQLIPNPYYALQTTAALLTLALSVLALESILTGRGEGEPSREPRPERRLLLPLVVLPVLLGFSHVIVRIEANAWRALPDARGVMSALVRLGHAATDFDGDGHGLIFAHTDCAPFDARAHPGQHERLGNGLDDDCEAGDPPDAATWIQEYEAAHAPPPRHDGDVILVVFDTLRFDDVEGDSYPGFAELRRRGVSFERAYASSSMTAMSMISVLGGLPAGSIPLDASDFSYVPTRPPPTLAVYLQSAGYDTAFVGGALPEDNPLFMEESYARGARLRRPTSMSERPERVTNLAVTAWRELSRPRFLYVHYMWTHWPETDHRGHRRRAEEVDLSLSRLIREIGFDPLWVVTADHGEEFGEHGGSHHASTLFDEVLHVPLVVAHPAVDGGRIVREVSSLRSIMPTVLAAVRPDLSSNRTDRKGPYLCLSNLDCHDVPVPIALRRRGIHLHGLIRGDLKIVRDIERDHVVVFDRSVDPDEQRPLEIVPRDLLDELARAEQYLFGPRSPELHWPY